MDTLTREEIEELLDRGSSLGVSEGKKLVEAVRGRPDLLEQAFDSTPERLWAATWAAGVLGERALADRVADLLLFRYQKMDPEWLDLADHVLPRLGPGPLPLYKKLFADPRTAFTVSETLAKVAVLYPEVREEVVTFLCQVLEGDDLEIRGEAVCCLMDMDAVEAMPAVVRAAERGLDEDKVGLSDVRNWQLGEKTPIVPRDLWTLVTQDHRAAFDRYREKLLEANHAYLDDSEWNRKFIDDLIRLREKAASPPPPMTVGRNEPCPCGSGKKFKKCCYRKTQEETRRDPLLVRLLTVEWLPIGYRMLASQQLAELPREEVERHLELLSMKPSQIKRELARETRDYVLWAGALRLLAAERSHDFAHFATLIAASDQDHPALDYASIGSMCHTTYDRKRHRSQFEFLFEANLEGGVVAAAWVNLGLACRRRPAFAGEAFARLWGHRPWTAWSAVAIAAVELAAGSEEALPYVQEALERVNRGEPSAHPMLPDEPCPAWVLEGYLEDLRKVRADRERWNKIFEGLDWRPLCVEDRKALELVELERRLAEQQLRDEYAEIARTSEDDVELKQRREEALAGHRADRSELEKRMQKLIHQILGRTYHDRSVVLAGDLRRRAAWLLPLRFERLPPEPELPLEGATGSGLWERFSAALGQVVVELGVPPARLTVGDWEGWAAVMLEVDGQSADDLRFLLEAVLHDWVPRIAVATTDALNLVAAALVLPQRFEGSPEPAAQAIEDEEEAQEETSDIELLARVLRRLLRLGKVGAAHTEIDHFTRGVPDSRKGFMKQCLALLVKHGYIRLKPTAKEPHISLEPGPLGTIKTFLDGGPPPKELAPLLSLLD